MSNLPIAYAIGAKPQKTKIFEKMGPDDCNTIPIGSGPAEAGADILLSDIQL